MKKENEDFDAWKEMNEYMDLGFHHDQTLPSTKCPDMFVRIYKYNEVLAEIPYNNDYRKVVMVVKFLRQYLRNEKIESILN